MGIELDCLVVVRPLEAYLGSDRIARNIDARCISIQCEVRRIAIDADAAIIAGEASIERVLINADIEVLRQVRAECAPRNRKG